MAKKRQGLKSFNDNQRKFKNKVLDEAPLFDDFKMMEIESDDNNTDLVIKVEEVVDEDIQQIQEGNKENDEKNFVKNDISTGREDNKSLKNKGNKEKTPSDKKLLRKEKRAAKKAAYKKTTFKHKLKVMAVLMVLGVFTGSGLGVWYFNFALKSNVDYSGNPADYIQSIDQTLTKNFKGIDLSNKQSWLTYAKSQNKTPADLSPVDNYVLAEYNATLATSYSVVGVGSILTMGFDQYMYSERLFDGNTYSFVSISPTTNAFVGDIAVCDIMQKGSSTIKSYNGTNNVEKGDTTADWAYNTSYTTAEYSDFTGVMVDSLTPYIIGEKTVLSSSEITVDENGNYTFTLQLHNVYSVLKYVRQVKRTGALAFFPEFSYISQTITITPDWQLVNIEITEKYSAVKMGVNAPINASMSTQFIFNEPVTLPNVTKS